MHERYMDEAIALAERSAGRVSPRPKVGAVIVDASGRVVGQGWTQPSPGVHAETAAIAAAGDRARGATMYVTLEPCSHYGTTPPCAEAVAAAGIATVYVAHADPNPLVDGAGIARLRRAGVRVHTGLRAERVARQLEPYLTFVRLGRPMVTLKMGASLDGKVAAPDGTSRWITSQASRAQVHEMRVGADAVMVGSGTVLADDPSLTARIDGDDRPQPLRVVADSSGIVPCSAAIFDRAAPLLMLTTPACPAEVRAAWAGARAEVEVVESGPSGGVALKPALERLGSRGVCSVLCEGGPRLAASFVLEGLADRVVLYLAPKLLGGDAPGLLAFGAQTLSDAREMRITSVEQVGPDLRIEGRL